MDKNYSLLLEAGVVLLSSQRALVISESFLQTIRAGLDKDQELKRRGQECLAYSHDQLRVPTPLCFSDDA